MIYLASNSPRRKELLGGLGIDFEVKILQDIDESFPPTIPVTDVAQYIASKKADAYDSFISETDDDDTCVITADTVVIVDDSILGKPTDEADAWRMLKLISGRAHQVTTGVCISTKKEKKVFSVTTDVTFKELCDDEIAYYIKQYKPFDKAGAYGIQEWIGYIGVTGLNGSYFNVMGFPVQRVYQELKNMNII